MRARVTWGPWGVVLCGLLFVSPAARADELAVRAVRDLSAVHGGVVNPGGVAWLPGSSRFVVTQAAAGEVSLGVLNAFGDPADAQKLAGGRVRSENVAFDSKRSRLVMLDDVTNELLVVPISAAGVLDATSVTRYAGPALGPVRAAGIAIDPATGTLYVLDRLSRRIAIVPEAMWAGEGTEAARAGWIELDTIEAVDLRGLGWDAAAGRWFVLDAAHLSLIAVDESGAESGRWELQSGLTAPRGLTVAPTGDRTDDPAAVSVYVADAGSEKQAGRVVEFKFRTALPLQVSATVSATLVRTINTYQWSPPSPDPSGIAYDNVQNRLLVSDGEVEEMSIYDGKNFFESSLTGSLLRSSNTTRFSDEPVGVAFDQASRVIITDDDTRTVFFVNVGSDGHVGGSDDTWTSFDTRDFGNDDPEGVAYDKAGNRLFFSDGLGEEVFQQRAGSDGTLGTSDDQVTHFDTSTLGINDPETVEYNPVSGTLFIIGQSHDKIVETSTTGSLLNTITLSGIALKSPAGMCIAPHSSNSGAASLYVCDRANDNDSMPSENDGKIFEITASVLGSFPGGGGGGGGGTPPGNGSDFPMAEGSDDAEQGGSSVAVNGSDIELVTDGSKVQTVGLRFDGITIPKNATITNAWIQFTADESQSEATSLVIEGQAADDPPTFTTSSNNISSRPRTSQSVTWNPASWDSEDGAGTAQKTASLTSIVQALVNRSGWSSGNAMVFIITGSGHRTAVAYEGDESDAAVLHIEVTTSNQKPSVNAGPDDAVTLPASASLNGTVSDDGLPGGPVTTQWTKQSGPGTVTFGNANAIDTQASFSIAGTYVLRLTANDGALSEYDEMQVTVTTSSGGGGGSGSSSSFPAKAESDDAEQAGSSVTINSSDLELVVDGSSVQVVGLRFPAITVPKNATIANAWIQFTADESQSGSISLKIEGQAADNAAAFTTGSNNISSRSRTSQSVNWSPPSWASSDGAGAAQKTPSLTAIVQALVNRPGWVSGYAMAFIITGTGHRTAMAYEAGAAQAPVLHIQLGSGGGPANVKPNVSAGPNRTVTLPGPASLDGTVSDDGQVGPLTTVWTKQSGPGTVTFVDPNAVDTQATFGTAGTYVLRLTASDGELSEFAEMQVTVNPPGGGGGGSTTLEKRIASGPDDVEQFATGKVDLVSSDIEMVLDEGNNQIVGLRFTGITIPKNATITNAWIQFTRDESGSTATALSLAGQAVDNAPAFTTASGNVSSRVKTAATVSWNPPAWGSGETAGPNQRTPGLQSIIQQLVNRPAWSSGNAIAFLITGSGCRTARAYESSASSAPLLHVEYTP